MLADRRGSEASGLVALADGWPAVIGLAALTDEIELPDEGVPEALYAYFAEELYQAADPELRWSLSQLSLSSTVAPAVAEAVLGRARPSGALLDGRRLGFLVPSEQGVDEIHPLLRVFLEEKFRELGGRSRARDRRAGRADASRAGGVGRRVLDRRALLRRGAARGGRRDGAPAGACSRRGCRRSRAGSSAPSSTRSMRRCSTSRRESSRSVPPTARARRHSASRRPAGSRKATRSCRGRSPSPAPAPTKSNKDITALDYFGRAEDVALTPADRRQAVWGRFLSMTALEREDGAAQALEELRRHEGHIGRWSAASRQWPPDACDPRGDIRASVDEMTVTAPLVAKATDPMIQSSALNAYAATLVLLGRYSDAHCRGN